MAIYHCSIKPISRGKGQSAIAAAAYRSATRLENEQAGLVHDFTRKDGVENSAIILPEGSAANWAKDRSRLWNAAEASERNKNARVAREFEIALPHELTSEQRLELTKDFAQELANRYGAAVDFAIHAPHRDGDIRNFHAHVMMTTRQVTETGLGDKTYIERENKWLLSNNLPTTQMQLTDLRRSWEQVANKHLARAGLDIRIDHRSHAERGLEIEPTEHMGVHATQMQRRDRAVSRVRLDESAGQRNAEVIRERPEQILTIITGEKSVFDCHDIARALHRYISDDAQAFQNASAAVMASAALVELQPERTGTAGEIELARYSTREMVEIEGRMSEAAERLAQQHTYDVSRQHVEQAIARQDAAIRASNRAARLSGEQREAIAHVTGPERVAAVVGFAGAGKSTMLAAAREAWEAQGYRVHGAALAGKAAEGLEEASGIQSRTLASWEYRWQNDRDRLKRGDVLVIDEAGMIGSRQFARFIGEAEKAGAKIVLVGDHEQLQAIGAGAPFRAVAEQVGYVELSEVRRQRDDWQRAASVAFATHRTGDGLAAYHERNAIRFTETRGDARAEIVRDYLTDRNVRPQGTRVALAHRRADVRAINDEIRTALQGRGALAKGKDAGEQTYQTNDGQRAFAPGDRIVFLENNSDLGVKNGMLGTVEKVEAGRIVASLDGKGDRINVPVADYTAFDHGYATTVHKSQGSTVDRTYVMASATMDRHLTYVAMTRHRDSVRLYAGMDEFSGRNAEQAYKQLQNRLGRSGVKETTLDYTRDFAERRGLAEQFGIRSEIELAQPSKQQDRGEDLGQPLVPAITDYARSIEDVAREKAMPMFQEDWKQMRPIAERVYTSPGVVMEKLRVAFINEGKSGQAFGKAVADRPEQFGELRGKSGMFGNNNERKEAIRSAELMGRRIEDVGNAWNRRLGEGRKNEAWLRERRDTVEVPSLTPQSEKVLNRVDQMRSEERQGGIDQLRQTPEGRQALTEAAQIAAALEKRFGHSDPRNFKKELERAAMLSPKLAAQAERIKAVAAVVYRTRNAELQRDYVRKQELTRGMGWSR